MVGPVADSTMAAARATWAASLTDTVRLLRKSRTRTSLGSLGEIVWSIVARVPGRISQDSASRFFDTTSGKPITEQTWSVRLAYAVDIAGIDGYSLDSDTAPTFEAINDNLGTSLRLGTIVTCKASSI